MQSSMAIKVFKPPKLERDKLTTGRFWARAYNKNTFHNKYEGKYMTHSPKSCWDEVYSLQVTLLTTKAKLNLKTSTMRNLQIISNKNRSLSLHVHLAFMPEKICQIHPFHPLPTRFGAPVSDCRPWALSMLEANVMTLPGGSFVDSIGSFPSRWIGAVLHPGAPTDAPALVISIVLSSNSWHFAHPRAWKKMELWWRENHPRNPKKLDMVKM